MKKLVALASMAVLLCASASFAKQAMDEEEMDLVTAAGQPSIIDIEVNTTGLGSNTGTTTSTSNATSTLDNTNATETSTAETTMFATGVAAGLGVAVDTDFFVIPGAFIGASIDGSALLQVDYSDTDIDTFSLSVVSGSVGTLTATASASASSTITGAVASVTSMNQDSSSVFLLVASGSQSSLRAMVLNNVAGENQLASAINVRAGAEATGDESTQSNSIIQSWGASYDWTFAEGAIETTSASAFAEADATANGGNGTIGTVGKVNCILTTAECGNANAGGDGGTATASTSTSTSTDVGVLEHLPLTISADKISRIRVNSNGDAIVNVSEMDSSSISVIVDSDSQTNLAALVVNNIGGRNQVASGINVASNGSVVIGNSGGVPLVVFDSLQLGQGIFGGGQSNDIKQFRGTPYQQ
jgi:hypothetical protein